MKKIISITLSIIMSALVLTSCASNTTTTTTTGQPTPIKREYTALVYDYSDGAGSGKKDIDLNHKTKKKSPAPNASVTINGVTYAGTYTSSWDSDFYNFDRDEYTYKNDNVSVRYTINASTGNVEGFSINQKRDKSYYDGKKIYSEDECLEIAKEYIKPYVPNIENYTLVSKNKTQDDVYKFKFREYIDGVRVGNDVFINVNIYGELDHFDYHTDIEDVEAFKKSGYLESINWDAVDAAIEKRACEAFSSSKIFGSFEVVNNDEYKTTKTLVKMADGGFALKCQVYVYMTYREEPNTGVTDNVLMLVYLD